MTDYVSIEARDVLYYAIIGYLAVKTNEIWQIEIKQEHIDFRLICRCGDIEFSTRCVYFEKEQVDRVGLLGVIFPYIDEVIVSWEREINES